MPPLIYRLDGELRTHVGRAWHGLLLRMHLAHPDPACTITATLTDAEPHPSLYIQATVRDTENPSRMRVDQAIHACELQIWPGESAAAAFVAILWCGYCTHEVLELARLDGRRVLDPHAPPFHADWAFRRAAPPFLTRETLAESLAVVLPRAEAERLARA